MLPAHARFYFLVTDYLASVLLLFTQENLDLKAAYESIQKELKVLFHV